MVNVNDLAPFSGAHMTDEGYLQSDVYTVRTGIQIYAGKELDRDGKLGLKDHAIVRVYRPEEEVFAADSVASFARIPVTNDHPKGAVTADNWSRLAVGETDSTVLRDGERLRIPMVVRDAAAIKLVRAGKREVSAGYTCDIDVVDGVTPDGQPYDAVMRNIRANHVAIVHRGRAGSEFRIGDDAGAVEWGATPLNDHNQEAAMPEQLKTVILDSKAVQVAAEDRDALVQYIDDKVKAHDAAIAVKDAELAKRDETITKLTADLKDAQLTDAQLDERVEVRAKLLTDARTLVKDYDGKGKADATIRKEVVVAKRGAEMADKSDAYIDAVFDMLLADLAKVAGKTDPVLKVLGDAKTQPSAGDYNAKNRQRIADAWKTPVKE